MFRYNIVPWKEENGRLVVVMADPSDVLMVDELEVLLGRPLTPCVGTKFAIHEVLKKSESGQRVLDAATEGFKIQVVRDDDEEEAEEDKPAEPEPVVAEAPAPVTKVPKAKRSKAAPQKSE